MTSGLSTLYKDHRAGAASRLAALLLPQIWPISSVVAPCDPGAALRDLVVAQRRQATGFSVGACVVLVAAMAGVGIAADRKWQTGTWGDITTTRRVVDFGPGASGFGRPGSTPEMRALADIRHFVIETDEMRIEAEDTVSVSRRSFDATSGTRVTFAVDKKTVYIRDADGGEHKLRLLKRIGRAATEGTPKSSR
jgi:hypothetical protein